MQKKLNAAIIGAGSIGGLIDSPDSKNISSHAHGYMVCDKTELKAICEVDANNVIEFKRRWGDVNSYENIEDMLCYEEIDIVSICTPTFLHKENLEKVFKCKSVKYVLCEKPLVSSMDELKELKEMICKSDKKVLINLMRRYEDNFEEIAKIVKNKELGEAVSFYGNCTKGLLHNGSHLLGVIQHFFGEIKKIEPLNNIGVYNDLCGKFSVEYLGVKGLVDVLDGINYSIFDIEIYFEEGLIHINASNIDVLKSIPSTVYVGYNVLEKSKVFENVLSKYALDSIEFLLNKDEAECKNILNEHIELHQKILETIGGYE